MPRLDGTSWASKVFRLALSEGVCVCVMWQDWAVIPVTGSTDALVKCFQLFKPDGGRHQGREGGGTRAMADVCRGLLACLWVVQRARRSCWPRHWSGLQCWASPSRWGEEPSCS